MKKLLEQKVLKCPFYPPPPPEQCCYARNIDGGITKPYPEHFWHSKQHWIGEREDQMVNLFMEIVQLV